MMNSEASADAVLLVSPDLLFAGKIQAAAGPFGLRVLQETELQGISRAVDENAVSVVFLDLNISSPSISEVMDQLPGDPRPMVVAFGPHVNTLRLEEAKWAGCDRVLPRSRFVQELPELVKLSRKAD
jgi:hypothetical protein